MKTRLHQTGDTIVEVLIAIAVASAVLGSAYAIVNRTVISQQRSSEHTEALKVAESQLELLRAHGADTTPTNPFCMNGTIPDEDTASCKIGPEGRYEPKIEKSGDLFTVKIVWKSLYGSDDQVSLSYKVF